MLQRVSCCVCLFTILAVPRLLLSQETRPSLAITHVHVVPMDRERVLTDQTVVIVGDHIAEIGPGDKVQLPKSAVEVDGTGKYLLPGLADMHVHATDEAMLLPGRTAVFLCNFCSPSQEVITSFWPFNELAIPRRCLR